MVYKAALLFCILLLSFPTKVGGGYICYASCLATVGVAGFIGGSAALTALRFTPGGKAARSWAAAWMATYADSVPVPDPGVSWASYGTVFKICTDLCTAGDYFDPKDEDNE